MPSQRRRAEHLLSVGERNAPAGRGGVALGRPGGILGAGAAREPGQVHVPELRQLGELLGRRVVAAAVRALDARLQEAHALALQLHRRARHVPRHAHQVGRDLLVHHLRAAGSALYCTVLCRKYGWVFTSL